MLQMAPIELGVALIGMVIAVPLGGAFLRLIPSLNRAEGPLLKGIPLKVGISLVAVVLGLSSMVLTPILPFLALIGVAKLLPLDPRARASLVIIGCLPIAIGTVLTLTTGDLPSSQIAALKLLRSPTQAALSDMLWR
jgi:predicted cation transporter